jgi:hypothetical protein
MPEMIKLVERKWVLDELKENKINEGKGHG